MSKLLPLACLAFLGSATGVAFAGGQALTPPAQENTAPDTPATDTATPTPPKAKPLRAAGKPEAKVEQVTISGSRANDNEMRRMSTASKLIFGREELDRNGDTSIGEILKRLPGVTMGGRPGRGGAVRMRGLGNGYTQMLVNGERPPAGFSLESLAPDQVERIEVIRGPVAEHSTQAIAGTINIVLREGYLQKDTSLKISDNIEQGRHGPNVSLTVPGKIGELTYLLTGSVASNRQHDASQTHNRDVTAAGVVQLDQQVSDESSRHSQSLHLSPRLSYRFADGDTLTFQPFLVSNRSKGSSTSLLTQGIGSKLPEYAALNGMSESSSTFLRGFGNWVHRIQGGAKLDVKFGFGAGHSDSENRRSGYDAGGTLVHSLFDTDSTRDRRINTGGKYTAPIGDGHHLAAGWDVEAGNRADTRVSLDNGSAAFADSGSNLTADTRRVASFVQDEWDITPQWSVYLGLRWEGIRTRSSSTGANASNTSSVWSPVLHAVWRIPGHEKDQVRASLTQSYRAPTLNDLIAAPSFSTQNSATRPDRTGNPSLKPELAKGIDVAYEHYLGRSGILSASGFVRDIQNLMRRETTLRDTATGPRWVSSPVNIGHALTSGVELEAKFQLVELVPDAPNIDFRSNYSHFWSHVDGVPGPDNRLDQQARQTANVGVDFRPKGMPLTLGASFNWTPGIVVQTSSTERVDSSVKRQLDVYGLWKFTPAIQLRVAASNLLGDDFESGRVVTTNGLAQMASTLAHTYTTLSLKLEMKL